LWAVEKPGHYRVEFRIRGNDLQVGDFLRSETRSIRVGISPVDDEASDLKVLLFLVILLMRRRVT